MISRNKKIWIILILSITLLALSMVSAEIIRGETSAVSSSAAFSCNNEQKCQEADSVWLSLQELLRVSSIILGKIWDPNLGWKSSSVVSSGVRESDGIREESSQIIES